MKPTRYVAIRPDGHAVTRNSHRDYRYAIFGVAGFGDDNPEGWREIGFAARLETAERTARQWRGKRYGWRETIVVPAVPEDRSHCPYCAPDEACATHTRLEDA